MRNLILLVEDETDLATIIADTLRNNGYEVMVARDGIEGLALFRSHGADLVIADVMMPRLDGFSMAKEMRRTSSSGTVPLLFLTAKGSIDDIERGFNLGADDYLKKPFELRELIVRVKALLRRGSDQADIPTEQQSQSPTRFQIGKYQLDLSAQTLSFNGREHQLTNMEALVLSQLVMNIGQTVDATELMLAVWRHDEQSNRNSLHAYIHKLRRLLRHDSSVVIINQRGFGYKLTVKSHPPIT